MKSVCLGIDKIIESDEVNFSNFYNEFEDEIKIIAPAGCWFFTSGCSQLAADTFRLPVAVYADREYENNLPEMFFPLIDTDTYHRTVEGSEDATPLPIILQNIGGYHWVTFKLKRSIKMLWPRPPPRAWNYFCNKLGKDTRYTRQAGPDICILFQSQSLL